MFHYGFLEAIPCRFKWVIQSDIKVAGDCLGNSLCFPHSQVQVQEGSCKQSSWQSFVIEEGVTKTA